MRKTYTYLIKAANAEVPVFGFSNDKAARDKEFKALVKRDGKEAWITQDIRTSIDRWHDRMRDRIVPYARVGKEQITTCSVEEDALGLSSLISGWCENGYYLAPRVRKTKLLAHFTSIDWKRVQRVKQEFGIRAGSGTMIISDRRVHFISEARYQRLMRHCLRSVPDSKFDLEIQSALTFCANRQKTYVSGSTIVPPRATQH